MSNTDTTTDLVLIDGDDTEYSGDSFGKEIGKTLVISTATTAGIVAGVMLVTALVPKLKNLVSRSKKSDDSAPEAVVHDITSAAKTAEA
jgi:hypothetical protein